MQGAPHILVVDDHREIRDLVSRALTKDGFRVSSAADGRAMRKILADGRIDLVLLDLMLPGEDGLSLCRGAARRIERPDHHADREGRGDRPGYRTRDGGRRLPSEALRQPRIDCTDQSSPAAQPGDKLESDPEQRPKSYQFDRWGLDTGSRALLRDDGVTVPLSTGEYDLLIALVERPQRVLNRDQLLDLARGRSSAGLDRSIDTQVSRLRKKLELDPSDPQIIKTVWGGGYMFTPAVSRQ
jgi:two-component system, OmpR family, response regulator